MVYPGRSRPVRVDRAAPGVGGASWRRRPAPSRTSRTRRTSSEARRSTASCGSSSIVAIVLGILFGLLFEEQALKAQWLAEAFIQLIKAITGPVIFVTVVIGIASLGDMARAGGLALQALGYFLAMTVIALALGPVGGQHDRAGRRLRGRGLRRRPAPTPRSRSARRAATRASSRFITDDLLPTSFVSPFVENEILRVLVLALLTAAAVSGLPKVQREKVVGVFEVAAQVIFRDHPHHHVGRADRRVRRHGVHGREVRGHLADAASAC